MAGERFRRALRGYDPEEVDAVMAKADARVVRLEREARHLAQRVMEKERLLQAALSRLDREAEASESTIGSLGRRLEEIHAQARRQATRIRMKALEDAVQIADRVTELSRIGRAPAEASPDGAPAGGSPADAPSAEEPPHVWEGPVEVEVGPLSDFAQLAGFEDAMARIRGAGEIRVRRFSGGRATVSVDLGDPVELLRELEQRAPFEFRVADRRPGRVVLDVEDDEQREAA